VLNISTMLPPLRPLLIASVIRSNPPSSSEPRGLVEGVELPEHLAGKEAEQAADLGAGDLGPDGLGDPVGLPLVEELAHHRLGGDLEPVGVGTHPTRAVDDQDRCSALDCVEARELADQPGAAVRTLAELGHHGVGLVPGHRRTLARQPRPERDRELPVHHLGLRGLRCARHAMKRTGGMCSRPPTRLISAAVRRPPGSSLRPYDAHPAHVDMRRLAPLTEQKGDGSAP
jgi:hypothetical protein